MTFPNDNNNQGQFGIGPNPTGQSPHGHSQMTPQPQFNRLGATTSGISFDSGGALIGTTLAGPIGGVVGAVAGAATGAFIGGYKK